MTAQADSTRMPSRRAFFAHAAASGVAATQPPLFTVPAAISNLAAACAWAVKHEATMNEASHAESWDDERVTMEVERCSAVYERAIAEPSQCKDDILAKARLLLEDLNRGGTFEDDHQPGRLGRVLLKEFAILDA